MRPAAPLLSTITDQTEPESSERRSQLTSMDSNRNGNGLISSISSGCTESSGSFGSTQSLEHSVAASERERPIDSAWTAFPSKVQRYLQDKVLDSSEGDLEQVVKLLKRYTLHELRAKMEQPEQPGQPMSPFQLTSVVSQRPPLSFDENNENQEMKPEIRSIDIRRQVESILKETKQNIQEAVMSKPAPSTSSMDLLIEAIESFKVCNDLEYHEQVEYVLKAMNDVLHYAEMDQYKIAEFCKAVNKAIVKKMKGQVETNAQAQEQAAHLEEVITELKQSLIEAESNVTRLQLEIKRLEEEGTEVNRLIGEKESANIDLEMAVNEKHEKLKEYKSIVLKTFETNKRFKAENERLRGTNVKRQNVISAVRDISMMCLQADKDRPKLIEALKSIEKVCQSVKSRDSSFH